MTYTIVIDVCNNRARKAYEKGLADLDAIWGQLMMYANQKDEENLGEWQATHDAWKKWDDEQKEKRDKELAQYELEMELYNQKMKEWARSQNSFFGGCGRQPTKPRYPFAICSIYCPTEPVKPDTYYKNYYESVKKELKNKFNLADAAMGMFRMTEQDVQAMIAWEDGSRVQELLDTIGKRIYCWNGKACFDKGNK